MSGGFILFHDPWPYAISYSAAAAIGALLMLELMSRWKFSRAFERWQDPLVLIGAAAIGATVVVALYCAGMMGYQWIWPGELEPADIALMSNAAGESPILTGAFLFALARWWADGVAGVVLFVPLLVATPPIWRTLRGHEMEAGFWTLILLGWVASMFLLHAVEARLPLVAVALMLLVWAVVRFGVASASIAISVCTMTSTLSFALQRGVLTTTDLNEGVDSLWGFLLLLAGIGMFLMSLLAERNRTLQRLAGTAMRARRLFECDPHPLWVQERATGRIVIVNEEAIRHYGYSESEWLAMSASRLEAIPGGAVNMPSTPDRRMVVTRHRVKSGVLIDVELSFAPIDMGGRSMLLCFAVDVTERNALQRGFLEATDSERRRLLGELQHGLGRALTELEFAATRLERNRDTGEATPASVDILARASQRAAELCRQTAHRVSAVGRTRPRSAAGVA
jgi:PAS domain S-box-containing protein